MEKDEKNEKIAFSNMINTLQVMHFFSCSHPIYAGMALGHRINLVESGSRTHAVMTDP